MAAPTKERLDVILVQRNLANSRELAKAYIMSGTVYVDGMKEDKAGTKIPITAEVEVRGNTMKYVSRGGYKLEKAMLAFDIILKDTICLDIGASTGGFTDCMLQNEAKKVYAIDVGYGQFAWKLRTDERVVCLEKTNVRYITANEVPDKANFASIDVSFISLTKILKAVLDVMADDGALVCLIKPQFEAGREKVGKKGVVKDPAVHREVIEKIVLFVNASEQIGHCLQVMGIDFSPIKGPEGNIEYLIYIKKVDQNATDIDGISLEESYQLIEKVVADSHLSAT